MTDIDNLRAQANRHYEASKAYHIYLATAPAPFKDDPKLRQARDMAEGSLGNALIEAFPALASELEAARKVVTAAEWFHEQQGRGTEEGCLFCEDIPEIGVKPCWLEDSLRAYLLVMEEQR